MTNMTIEIVDFPSWKMGGSFHSYVNVYQRVMSIRDFAKPWFINEGTPPRVIIQYLNGIPPIKQPKGLLIQG